MAAFVLVHGGMSGGWCWQRVSAILQGAGHRVLSPTLTGLGERKHLLHQGIDLELHITDVINIILYEGVQKLVLVGHSYGGMVITGVANRIPERIVQLVYLDALIPTDGESLFDCLEPEVKDYLCHRAEMSGGEVIPPHPAENYDFTDQADSDWFIPRCTAQPFKTFEQPLKLKGLPQANRVYIQCTQDHALDNMPVRAKELGIQCYSIDSGHFPMVTHPQKLADLLGRVIH